MKRWDGMPMAEITSFLNLPVYTQSGTFVGTVRNVVMDVSSRKVHGLHLSRTNPDVVENSLDVTVPYRWVKSADDIVILSYFPKKVKVRGEESEQKKVAA